VNASITSLHMNCGNLKYSNHSPEFYRLLERILPDWERRKAKLELGLV